MAKRYSEVEIERGMIAAATLGLRPAGRQLGIPWQTIQDWVRDRPEQYAEIKTQEAPKWRERAAASFETIVDGITALEADNLTKLSDHLDDVDAKDRGRLAKDLATAKGINAQHVHQLRDRPSLVVEHKVSMPAIERGLEKLGVLDAVESTTTEVETPALPPAA